MSELQSLVLHCHNYEELFTKVMKVRNSDLFTCRQDLFHSKVANSFRKFLADNGYKTLVPYYFARTDQYINTTKIGWYGVTLEGKSNEIVHFKLKYL